MWFGTQDGLNRYDGYTFTVFRHDPQDTQSISDNYITALYEDHQGQLWIGTHDGGLNKLNNATETFSGYPYDLQNLSNSRQHHITAICEDDAGVLWIGTEEGLLGLSKNRASFQRYVHEPTDSKSLSHNYVTSLRVDRHGKLWIGTEGGGLNCYDGAAFTHFYGNPQNSHSLGYKYVRALFENRAGELWIGTLGQGLSKLVRHDNSGQSHASFQRYPYEALSIAETDDGTLWIGNRTGLLCFDPSKEQFTPIIYDSENFSGLSATIISS
jgi:ligand-binding sensor domain-containing protein